MFVQDPKVKNAPDPISGSATRIHEDKWITVTGTCEKMRTLSPLSLIPGSISSNKLNFPLIIREQFNHNHGMSFCFCYRMRRLR
jgi:hypothetical protein